MLLRSSRRGFTLIEMLLVMAIVVILASILIPLTLRFQDSNLVPQAAADIQGALAQAKANATFTNRRQGVRFIPMVKNIPANLAATDFSPGRINPALLAPPNVFLPNAPENANYLAWYNKIEFVEDPGDYQEMWVWSALPNGTDRKAVLMPFYPNNLPLPSQVSTGLAPLIVRDPPSLPFTEHFPNRVYGPIGASPVLATWTDADGVAHPVGRLAFNFFGHVRIGDRVEFHGNGQVYVVLAINSPLVGVEAPMPIPPTMDVWTGGPTYMTTSTIQRPSYLVLDRALTNDVLPPPVNRPNYRVIRQPRSVPSIKPVSLPKEVVLELLNQHPQHNTMARDPANTIWMRGVSTISVTPGTPVDIMFGPSGNVVSVSTPLGTVANINQGLIHLWIHRYSNPTTWFARNPAAADSRPDTQALLSIYTRTGAISSYRVNQSANPLNPWADAATGRGQGIGGL